MLFKSFFDETRKVAAIENHGRHNEKENGEPYSFNDIGLMIWLMRQDISTMTMVLTMQAPWPLMAFALGLLRIAFYAVGTYAALTYLKVI